MAGISSYSAGKVSTVKSKLILAYASGIDNYIENNLDKPLLKYMKTRQLESVGYGKYYPYITKQSTGEVFTDHRASKAGEPAANLSGELANSYKSSYIRASKQISFYNTAPYAEFLHHRGSLSFYLESKNYSNTYTEKPKQLTVEAVRAGIQNYAEAYLRSRYQYI
jgi:hypothetical protein